MGKTWVISDHHLGHRNIVKFLDGDGNQIRPFSSVEEHDSIVISNHNSLVDAKDRVYFLGDVVINRKSLPLISSLRGRKKLILGNHDIFKASEYLKYFDDVIAYRMYPEHGIILSHIPVHSNQLENRFKLNVHGHLHQHVVLSSPHHADTRYRNVCLEHTGFKPVLLDDIIKSL